MIYLSIRILKLSYQKKTKLFSFLLSKQDNIKQINEFSHLSSKEKWFKVAKRSSICETSDRKKAVKRLRKYDW